MLLQRIAFAALLLATLSACSTLQPDFETPTVSVTSIRSVSGDQPGINFEIDLKVVNPNRDALKLKGVTYTLNLEGRDVVTGVGKDLPTISGYGEGIVTLTATLSMMESLQLFAELAGQPRDSLRYKLDTKLDIGALYPTIRVSDEGRISLATPR